MASTSTSLIDIIVTSPTIIDHNIFDYWLKGYTVEEVLVELFPLQHIHQQQRLQKCIKSNIIDHYRNFSLLEHFFTEKEMYEHCYLHISLGERQYMMERYYQLHTMFLRGLLGMKISPKTRVYVSLLSEKTKIRYKAGLRMYDNLARVYQELEEDDSSNLVNTIQKEFQFPLELAKLYACVCFLLKFRFEVNLSYLHAIPFSVFSYSAGILINEWLDDGDIKFIEDLNTTVSGINFGGNQMTSIINALVSVGNNLTKGKEIRNLFVSLLENIVLLLFKPTLMSPDEVKNMFYTIYQCNYRVSNSTLWLRFLRGVLPICYHFFKCLYLHDSTLTKIPKLVA